eukprot:764075-Hanusia_phi.AAC.6
MGSARKKKNPRKHYKILHEVGRGTFGVVCKAIKKKTGEEVAIKNIKLVHKIHEGVSTSAIDEIRIMQVGGRREERVTERVSGRGRSCIIPTYSPSTKSSLPGRGTQVHSPPPLSPFPLPLFLALALPLKQGCHQGGDALAGLGFHSHGHGDDHQGQRHDVREVRADAFRRHQVLHAGAFQSTPPLLAPPCTISPCWPYPSHLSRCFSEGSTLAIRILCFTETSRSDGGCKMFALINLSRPISS